MFPTISKLVDIPIPTDRIIDGVDMSPILFEDGKVHNIMCLLCCLLLPELAYLSALHHLTIKLYLTIQLISYTPNISLLHFQCIGNVLLYCHIQFLIITYVYLNGCNHAVKIFIVEH